MYGTWHDMAWNSHFHWMFFKSACSRKRLCQLKSCSAIYYPFDPRRRALSLHTSISWPKNGDINNNVLYFRLQMIKWDNAYKEHKTALGTYWVLSNLLLISYFIIVIIFILKCDPNDWPEILIIIIINTMIIVASTIIYSARIWKRSRLKGPFTVHENLKKTFMNNK